MLLLLGATQLPIALWHRGRRATEENPHCSTREWNYEGNKKIPERIGALSEVRDSHRDVTKRTCGPRTCPHRRQLPRRQQTSRKKVILIPVFSPPLSNRMTRSSWLLFAPAVDILIAVFTQTAFKSHGWAGLVPQMEKLPWAFQGPQKRKQM